MFNFIRYPLYIYWNSRKKLCTAFNFSKYEIVCSISAALAAFQCSSSLIPGFPHFPGQLPPWASRDPSSKFKQNPHLVELCVMLFLAFWPCFSFLTSSVLSAPEILSAYCLFDILVRCFSYCCPTLVVRWTVLLSKTLDRWTGLYYQRWVSVPAPKWGAVGGELRTVRNIFIDAVRCTFQEI